MGDTLVVLGARNEFIENEFVIKSKSVRKTKLRIVHSLLSVYNITV